MWEPANKAALPSPADFKYAQGAIDELEDALKDALAALERAQLKVLALTKDLDERRAWLAPVRKLPSELLSEVFIFGSEMEHLAPVTISEVSQLWRAIVLATPQAWSLIYTNAPQHQKHLVQYVSTFVERSNPCLLHIWVQDEPNEDEDSEDSDYEAPENKVLSLLLSSLSRIRCLSIESRRLMTLTQESMPNLTRLWIIGIGEKINPFFINKANFPRLQSVESIGGSWEGSMSLTSFPPLQELAIRVNPHPTWLEVVKNCSATLKSLRLVGNLTWTEPVTILFPRLEALGLNDWCNWPIIQDSTEWSINMVTPALITYEEDVALVHVESKPRHGDVKSVKYLGCNRLLDLASYTNLLTIRLTAFKSRYVVLAHELAERLEQTPDSCPALQRVEAHATMSDVKLLEDGLQRREIIGKFTRARPSIEVVFARQFTAMPKSMQESKCGPGMPCVEEQGRGITPRHW